MSIPLWGTAIRRRPDPGREPDGVDGRRPERPPDERPGADGSIASSFPKCVKFLLTVFVVVVMVVAVVRILSSRKASLGGSSGDDLIGDPRNIVELTRSLLPRPFDLESYAEVFTVQAAAFDHGSADAYLLRKAAEALGDATSLIQDIALKAVRNQDTLQNGLRRLAKQVGAGPVPSDECRRLAQEAGGVLADYNQGQRELVDQVSSALLELARTNDILNEVMRVSSNGGTAYEDGPGYRLPEPGFLSLSHLKRCSQRPTPRQCPSVRELKAAYDRATGVRYRLNWIPEAFSPSAPSESLSAVLGNLSDWGVIGEHAAFAKDANSGWGQWISDLSRTASRGADAWQSLEYRAAGDGAGQVEVSEKGGPVDGSCRLRELLTECLDRSFFQSATGPLEG
ncbi:hypothetical protein DL769_006385 [Monosporascus sp. CRB-8-3]|nr:hypothetical protein DL769_006385 [Monosporascus sp. CRB-8-3]